MVGYIFKAENTVTGKIYIGKFLSVKFNKKYLGNNPGVISDAEKYGADKFIVNMIKVCETVKDCEMAYTAILKEYNAENDEKFYNFKPKVQDVPKDEKPAKKPRKKKAVVEE